MQLALQPSPMAMLLSSHCSPGSITPLPQTAGIHAPLLSTRPLSQSWHVAPGPLHERQPGSHAAHTEFDVGEQDATVYVPCPQNVHGLHTRSAIGPHGDASNMPSMHAGEHNVQTVSATGEHGAEMNCVGAHAVQAAQEKPSPVKPGPHRHSTEVPVSTHIACALQPPLLVAHAPAALRQWPPEHVSVMPQRVPQAPQFSGSVWRSTQPSSHTVDESGHETSAG